jgi:hypothetical protein
VVEKGRRLREGGDSREGGRGRGAQGGLDEAHTCTTKRTDARAHARTHATRPLRNAQLLDDLDVALHERVQALQREYLGADGLAQRQQLALALGVVGQVLVQEVQVVVGLALEVVPVVVVVVVVVVVDDDDVGRRVQFSAGVAVAVVMVAAAAVVMMMTMMMTATTATLMLVLLQMMMMMLLLMQNRDGKAQQQTRADTHAREAGRRVEVHELAVGDVTLDEVVVPAL